MASLIVAALCLPERVEACPSCDAPTRPMVLAETWTHTYRSATPKSSSSSSKSSRKTVTPRRSKKNETYTARGRSYRDYEVRQLGGYCIYGADGVLLHTNAKGCRPKGDPAGNAAAVQRETGRAAATGATGCVAGNCRDGQGTWVWKDGSQYVGRFSGGRQHGHGIFLFANGTTYVGDWTEGKREGFGTATYMDGRMQTGRWQANRFVGEGLTTTTERRAEVRWPSLAAPARTVGGGKKDAAVIVGLGSYANIPPIVGASENASAWYEYLIRTRGIPLERVTLLLDDDAAREDIEYAIEEAAGSVARGGTLWFVFIGHGAPARDGRDGLLVGFDAQQKARSVEARSVRRSELLATLEKSRAKQIHVVLDACFSGRSTRGAQLVAGLQPLVVTAEGPTSDDRTIVLTAARSDQYAGPLPGSGRPAFSYLALGALRGWGDADDDGQVTAGEVHGYASRAMQALVRDRRQQPLLVGDDDRRLARSPDEDGPDLSALVLQGASTPARSR